MVSKMGFQMGEFSNGGFTLFKLFEFNKVFIRKTVENLVNLLV